MADLFGSGLQYPVKLNVNGRLPLQAGELRISASIQRTLDARRYECPMDPLYGIEPELYDPMNDPGPTAFKIGLDVARGEPRVAKLVVLPEPQRDGDTVRALMRFRIADDNSENNRVQELYTITDVAS